MTRKVLKNEGVPIISIHILRVEDDQRAVVRHVGANGISIHILRVEDDDGGKQLKQLGEISIHILRVEDDKLHYNFVG